MGCCSGKSTVEGNDNKNTTDGGGGGGGGGTVGVENSGVDARYYPNPQVSQEQNIYLYRNPN